MKSGSLYFLEPSGPVQASKGTALPLPLHGILSQRTTAKTSGDASFCPLYFAGRVVSTEGGALHPINGSPVSAG